jgi:hypothetical protein
MDTSSGKLSSSYKWENYFRDRSSVGNGNILSWYEVIFYLKCMERQEDSGGFPERILIASLILLPSKT